MLNLPGFAVVVNDGFLVVDALMDSIAVDAIVNECSTVVTVNSANDDDDQRFACGFVVAPHTYLLDHYRVLYLNRAKQNQICHNE